jgi:hypothetical protein
MSSVAVRKLGRRTMELGSETASMAVNREFEILCCVLLKFARAYKRYEDGNRKE